MREYGQIQCSFWTDPDIQSLSDHGKLLATYLLTGPHSNGLGCFRLPDGYIQADLGWTSERVSKGFTELFQTGFAKRCESTFFVLIPKFLKWNPISNANIASAREKDFDIVPKKFTYYSDLCKSLKLYGKHLANPFLNRLETLSQTVPEQNQTKPNQTKPITTDGPADASSTDDPATAEQDDDAGIHHGPYPAEFENAWSLYPKREGANPKRRAFKAWNARIQGGCAATEMLDGTKRYAAHIRVKGKEGTEFVLQAATFFGPDEHFREPWTVTPSESKRTPGYDPDTGYRGNIL